MHNFISGYEFLGDWAFIENVKAQFSLSYMTNIANEVELASRNNTLNPYKENVFRALKLCPLEKLKVIIVGQDPYPGEHADGLAFSSRIDNLPYSLKVIFDELRRSYMKNRIRLSLDDWAQQGVLLLNTSLTTVKGKILGHKHLNWPMFTSVVIDEAVNYCQQREAPLVVMLWGSHAQNFFKSKTTGTTLVLKHTHPAAVRYGHQFSGCGHFSKAHEFLIANNSSPVIWL